MAGLAGFLDNRKMAASGCPSRLGGSGEKTMLVEKKLFELPSYETVGGRTIKPVRFGYETYGRLNAAGDNAIFVAHYYSGSSHAAGKYRADDVEPGYWDAIIGPGKVIDTDRYFVIGADCLANLAVHSPNVVTTGPASIDPDTGQPYGMRFPVVAPRDFVRVHRALLDHLGVRRLQAVIGASGGSMQAFEWAALYPDFVDRVIAVVSPGLAINPYCIMTLDLWTLPIRLDANWNGGDYYGRAEPRQGLIEALKLVIYSGRHFGWAEKTFGYRWAEDGKNPADKLDHLFLIEDDLRRFAAERAALVDANHMIYTSKAYQLYNLDAEVGRIKARVLLIPAQLDLIFPPVLSYRAAERLRANGTEAVVRELEGDGGHLDAVYAIDRAAQAIAEFLGLPPADFR
jgi:homoserine O-acetyltransferase